MVDKGEEGVEVGAQCGGRPDGRGGFSVVDRVGSRGVGRVEGEQEPMGGNDDA